MIVERRYGDAFEALFSFRAKNAVPHEELDARAPKLFNALARYERIGILGPDDHPCEAVFDNGARARRRLAVVTAWF